MDVADNSTGHAGEQLPMMEQMLANDADRCLAELRIGDKAQKTKPASDGVGRCLTSRTTPRSRSPKDGEMPVFNQNLSIADELDQLSDDDEAAPADWTVDPADQISESAGLDEDPSESIDLSDSEVDQDLKAPEAAKHGLGNSYQNPGKPSEQGLVIQDADDEDYTIDAPDDRQGSPSSCQRPGSESPIFEIGFDEEDVEEENPRRSRLDVWMGSNLRDKTSSSDVKTKNSSTPSSVSGTTDVPLSIPDFDSEEPTLGPPNAQRTPRKTPSGTNNGDRNKPKVISSLQRSDSLDLDNIEERQRITPLAHQYRDSDTTNERPLPPLPPTPMDTAVTALQGKTLGDFIETSVSQIDAMYFNKKEKHASSKVKEIQHLVEVVLMDGVYGERRSFGDMLDGSSWRG